MGWGRHLCAVLACVCTCVHVCACVPACVYVRPRSSAAFDHNVGSNTCLCAMHTCLLTLTTACAPRTYARMPLATTVTLHDACMCYASDRSAAPFPQARSCSHGRSSGTTGPRTCTCTSASTRRLRWLTRSSHTGARPTGSESRPASLLKHRC